MKEIQNSDIQLIKLPTTIQNDNKEIQKNFENGTEVKFYFTKLLNFDYSLMLFSSLSILLSILYYDADYGNTSPVSIICLYIINIVTLIEIVLTVYRYKALIQLQIAQRELSKYQTLASSNKIYSVLLQIFILLLQPYPFLNDIYIKTVDVYDDFQFEFKFNYIMVILSFFKLFIVLRLFLLSTNYMSPRASRNCRLYGCSSNYLFAIKCLFKDSPMVLMGVVFSVSIIIFAIGIRISERNLNLQYPKNFGSADPQDLQNFMNTVWLTIITMTTVGYGDLFPKTLIGRTIVVFLVIWGIFIVSLMVVVLTNALNMDSSESRALVVLNRLEAKKLIKQKAANLIACSFKRFKFQKQMKKQNNRLHENKIKKQIKQLNWKLHNYSKQFQVLNRYIQSIYENDNVYEQMTRQFQFISDQISFLIDNQSDTIDYLKTYLKEYDNQGEAMNNIE